MLFNFEIIVISFQMSFMNAELHYLIPLALPSLKVCVSYYINKDYNYLHIYFNLRYFNELEH